MSRIVTAAELEHRTLEYLQQLYRQVQQDLTEPPRIAAHIRRHPLADLEPDGRAMRLRRGPEQVDRAGEQWWPVLGAAYLLHGVKRVQGMRLITPHWRDRKATSKRLSPVAQRDGGTRKTQ